MTELRTPTEAISSVQQIVAGLPACIVGSSVAAEAYGLPLGKEADIDVFCFSPEAAVVTIQKLLSVFEIAPRFDRVWRRWLKFGMPSWHTLSMKLTDPATGLMVNIVHKKIAKHPVSTLSAVLESFDFGLLAMGYDLELGTFHDMRSYMFPTLDPNGPLPLMHLRRDSWRNGFISEYQGLREMGRYAKYCSYGFDMSLVKDDLIEGYLNAASYLSDRDNPQKQMLSKIYYSAADKLEHDDIDALHQVSAMLPTLDSLDTLMDALE